MKKGFVTALLFGICLALLGQTSDVKSIAAAVELDSVVIVAKSKGFSIEEFIELVQTDQSFYQAFKNLRSESYRFDVDMHFYDKKEAERASYFAKNIQWYETGCRRMETFDQGYKGKFYKRKKNPKYKYYTASLYHRLFCTDGVVCSDEDPISSSNGMDDQQKMESHVSQLKKLIFSPGQQADVPFIKNKTAIFSERMRRFYDFKITSEVYHSVDCYVFTANVKPEYTNHPSRTVIKQLSTWFGKSDFQVMGRTYQLQHRTAVYAFDVSMQIDLVKKGKEYFPTYISYDGYWNVVLKKYEKGTFAVRFSDFGMQKKE
jgi:hypothetical protein